MHPGTRLGPFEIVAPLGAGGMGEVYRAQDTRLGREVAIKVLPAEFAADPERLRRFEQEARAASALNHPNIVVVFDVGTAVVSLRGPEGAEAIPPDTPGPPRPLRGLAVKEGVEEVEVHYLVEELLEGESLRERLKDGALPPRKAVEIAVQVCSGLAAAHEKGILHRDLKPENLFITSDGRVKILDFGVAKLKQERPEIAIAPTAVDTTAPGMVIGTVAYMSPEQVRGLPVDQRSDIFSLGCVLYEMLTARRPFSGETVADTVTAVLSKDPPPLSAPGWEIPPALQAIERRCLEKRRQERFSSAHDLALALEALSNSERLAGPVATDVCGPAAARLRRLRVLASVAAVAVALLAVATLRLWKSRQTAPFLGPAHDRVVVAIFENRTGDVALDTLGVMAADMLTQGLSRTGTLSVALNPTVGLGAGTLPAPTTTPGAGSPIEALAKQTEAGLVVAGTYYLEGRMVRFEPKLVRADGHLLAGLSPVAGSRDAPSQLVEALGQQVLGAVASTLDRTVDPSVMRVPSWEAYRECERAWEVFGSDFPQATRRFQRVVEIEPSWYFPRYGLFLAFVHQGLWPEAAQQVAAADRCEAELTPFERLVLRSSRAQLAGQHEEALAITQEMQRQAPGLPWITLNTGAFALLTNRPRYAIQQMSRLTGSIFPGNSEMTYWPLRSIMWSHHDLGEYEDELEAARRGRREFPTARMFVTGELRALVALGRLEEIDRLVEEALAGQSPRSLPGGFLETLSLELRAHGHRDAALRLANRAVGLVSALPPETASKPAARASLAQRLYDAERWEEARHVAESIAKDMPDDVSAMGLLGTLAARRGDRTTALAISERLRRLNEPFLFGQHTYSRACIAAQLGDKEAAVALLRQSVNEGLPVWEGLAFTLHRDIDLEPLRGFPPYEELIRPKG